MIPKYLKPFFWRDSYADGDKGRLQIPGHKETEKPHEFVMVLNRYGFRVNCTRGKLVCGDQVVETLEPVKRNDNKKPRCIDPGRYQLVFYNSPTHGYEVLLLLGVKGFTMVEIHIGNYAHNTKACILPGLSGGENFVSHSADAFEKIIKIAKKAHSKGCSLWIEVIESEVTV